MSAVLLAVEREDAAILRGALEAYAALAQRNAPGEISEHVAKVLRAYAAELAEGAKNLEDAG